jgi:hypothetical protein
LNFSSLESREPKAGGHLTIKQQELGKLRKQGPKSLFVSSFNPGYIKSYFNFNIFNNL